MMEYLLPSFYVTPNVEPDVKQSRRQRRRRGEVSIGVRGAHLQ
jgi:hypothetical protein